MCIRDSYDATVAAADREVGALIDALRELALLDRTIVVVTSDHGEEFGEHGGFGHGRTLYEEVLHVPLMVCAPGIAPHPVSDEVTLADVAPTLLSLCGLEPLPGAGGRALLPEPAGEEPVIAAEVDEAHLGSQRALWLGGKKLIVVDRMSPIRPPLPTHACFDLASDPGEKTNLVRLDADGAALPDAEQPPFLLLLAARLTDVFAGYSQQRAQLQVDVNAPSVSDPDLEKLGYGVGNEKSRAVGNDKPRDH